MTIHDQLKALEIVHRHFDTGGISTSKLAKALGWGRGRTINALSDMEIVGWVTTSTKYSGCVKAHMHGATWRGIMVLALHDPEHAECHGDDRNIQLACSPMYGTLRANFEDGSQYIPF